MTNEIGEAAGKVWRHLHRHGEMSCNALIKGTGLPQRLADRAIGWLAREGKLNFRREGNTELISLTE